jgi:hypothetical protein
MPALFYIIILTNIFIEEGGTKSLRCEIDNSLLLQRYPCEEIK